MMQIVDESLDVVDVLNRFEGVSYFFLPPILFELHPILLGLCLIRACVLRKFRRKKAHWKDEEKEV